MSKRGQAAMEFLMTYGWAILAVLISIAALAYFGVLNPSRFLPESCTLFPGVACIDSSANNVAVTLTVRNGLGQNLNPFSISIPGCTPASANNGLSDGEKETIVLTCNPGFVTNSKLKKDIDVTYTATSVSHTRRGSISTAVEEGYVANGGFEYGSGFVFVSGVKSFNWTYDIGTFAGIGSIDSTTPHTGSNSFKEITTTVGGEYPLITQPFAYNLPAGTYTGSFWAKASAPTTLRFVFANTVTALCGAAVFSVTTTWTKFTDTCTSSFPLVAFYIPLGASAVTFWIDDVEIKKV